MEDFVRDAILENDFHDLVLLRLVELTIADVQGSRPLFASLIEEPAFYRKCFRQWVSEALDERRASEEFAARGMFPDGNFPIADDR